MIDIIKVVLLDLEANPENWSVSGSKGSGYDITNYTWKHPVRIEKYSNFFQRTRISINISLKSDKGQYRDRDWRSINLGIKSRFKMRGRVNKRIRYGEGIEKREKKEAEIALQEKINKAMLGNLSVPEIAKMKCELGEF